MHQGKCACKIVKQQPTNKSLRMKSSLELGKKVCKKGNMDVGNNTARVVADYNCTKYASKVEMKQAKSGKGEYLGLCQNYTQGMLHGTRQESIAGNVGRKRTKEFAR